MPIATDLRQSDVHRILRSIHSIAVAFAIFRSVHLCWFPTQFSTPPNPIVCPMIHNQICFKAIRLGQLSLWPRYCTRTPTASVQRLLQKKTNGKCKYSMEVTVQWIAYLHFLEEVSLETGIIAYKSHFYDINIISRTENIQSKSISARILFFSREYRASAQKKSTRALCIELYAMSNSQT